MYPPPLRSLAADPVAHGQASQSALPTRSFYDGAAMDRRAGDIGHASACGPTDVPAGARLIGNVDDTCHDSMRAYEEQHGRPMRAKMTDVHDTRTATARLSRARKKGTGASIPYYRRRPHPFFRNSDETRQMSAAPDGRGGVDGGDRVNESGRGEKRRSGTIIIHDDSSTTAEGGETTGADDPDDSDYVPRIRMADGDDDAGRRVMVEEDGGRCFGLSFGHPSKVDDYGGWGEGDGEEGGGGRRCKAIGYAGWVWVMVEEDGARRLAMADGCR
ncbi:hypothetical protein CBR_g31043 [Chara braunii]|uniref:Uncharacterized protein n=1 Tax=Chara braunii TaxID=69332 RepID=A0A388LED9_CHABU|nr:hypothetical protein CBR_g31043 [Chara braunii]|eukprot:GBG80583.1 hypothetical protein CBR_g31043 [Chara braunii]